MMLHSRHPNQQPSDELLARYLSDECTADERLRVEEWASRDPARLGTFAELRELWSAPAQALSEWDVEGMRARFRARLRAQRVPAIAPWTTTARPSRWRWAAAAAAGLIVAGALWTYRERRSTPAPVQVAEADSSRFTTRRGQRATITLTDGTRVTLGVNSRLAVAPAFGRGARVVSLEGEAYFDVAPDSSAPFLVRTASSVTQVVGTAFAVREYAEDRSASIAVERGRVAIGRHVSSAMLGPGDVGHVTGDGAMRVRHDPRAMAALTAWRDGWFTLVNTPLGQAAQELSRWYDLDVRVPDAQLRRRVVNVRFDNVAPDAVLRAIAEAVGARLVWNGRTATFQIN